MRVGVRKAVKRFLKTATFSGLKYFLSPFYLDCLVWAVWSCLCVCAGVALCVALWGRFVQEPTLLAVLDARMNTANAVAPAIAVCPTPSRVAQLFSQHMSVQAQEIYALPWLFETLLRFRKLEQEQVQLLEQLLIRNNVTLYRAIMNVTDVCSSLFRSCRWQGRDEPCDQLFHKEMTSWGACCLLPPDKPIQMVGDEVKLNSPILDIMLQCPAGSVNDCFEVRCSEEHCGCSRLLQTPDEWLQHVYQPCSVDKLNCLRSYEAKGQCQCPPACQKITSFAKVESGQISQVDNTFDTMFAGANDTSVMVSLRINNSGSRMLQLINNESWWSLLSSLGGVFSMFLGIGVITVLEVLYFMLHLLYGCFSHRDSTSALHPHISAPQMLQSPSTPSNSLTRPAVSERSHIIII